MIVDIEPGDRVEVPARADFLVRCATSYSAGELAQSDSAFALEYSLPDASVNEVAGEADGTDVIFTVTKDLLAVGECGANPRITVGGETSRWPKPVTLIVNDPTAITK